MNKVAVHPNSSYRDSPPSSLPHYRPVGMEQKQFTKQPSRLQMLQADYQQKLLREKEEKMIRMYEDQQSRALGKVNQRQNSGSSSNGMSAREFFQERRKLEQKGYQSPPIDEHYRQARRGYSSSGHSSASSHTSSRYGKNSAGKDRSNLLQPIDMKTPPVPTKPRMARQRPNNTVQARNNANRGQMSNGNYDVRSDNSRTSSNDSSPPPNLQTLRNFQRRRLGAPPPPRDEIEGPQKLTDFQRWQMEQNKAREERLENKRKSVEGHRSQGGQQWGDADSDEGDKENMRLQDDLQQKQREIQEEIERQQRELEDMQRQKEEEEEQARRAAEAERKRDAERDRRKRQQAAEERKRRKEEEERERKEEERHREEEKRQLYEQQKRQQQQQKRRAPPPKPRTPSPAEDDYYQPPDRNLDLYEQAWKDSEAQESGSVRLSPCKVCGRKFAADRLGKHQAACKNANKKRKVFDPTKMRTEGTEMAQYVSKAKTKRPEPKKKADWRHQHESFIETIRYAKKVSEMEAAGVKPQNLPPPPRTENPNYVRCPTCNRNFNPSTAEKHIPNCRARPRR